MRRAVLLLLALGCAHAKQVETPTEAKPQPQHERPAASLPARPPPPGHPTLATSPEATFEPGAVHDIQRALRARGFRAPESRALDEATHSQIARFQKSQSLPDTGFPDDLTLRKLDLDPTTLHRSSAHER